MIASEEAMPQIDELAGGPDYELAALELEHASQEIASYVPKLERLQAYLEGRHPPSDNRPTDLAIHFDDLFGVHQSGEHAFQRHLDIYPNLAEEWIPATLRQFKFTLVEGLRAVMFEKSQLLLKCAAICRHKGKIAPSSPANISHHYYVEVHMGDKYTANQVGIMGRNVHTHDTTVQQTLQQSAVKIDLAALTQELEKLRLALKAEATTAKDDVAVGEVALAEVAATQNDVSHLKNAGKWPSASQRR
jgi:hypothetical protein